MTSLHSPALAEPAAEVRTQAQLLRAVADLVERHAPDLPARDWHCVYAWASSFGHDRELVRALFAELSQVAARVEQDRDEFYFDAVFHLGQAEVRFRFACHEVAERRTELAEREVWALVPPAAALTTEGSAA